MEFRQCNGKVLAFFSEDDRSTDVEHPRCEDKELGGIKTSLRLMMPWLQVYDNDEYGRWLVEFWSEISCLQEEKAQYMVDGLFAQPMTGKPYSCLPQDLWIEMTMNKGSKMAAGWRKILKNEEMLLSHERNAKFNQ